MAKLLIFRRRKPTSEEIAEIYNDDLRARIELMKGSRSKVRTTENNEASV